VLARKESRMFFISQNLRCRVIVVFIDAGLYGAVYLATFLISNIVTNNAAAALVFPIAMTAAEDTGADVVLMSYCVMLGASASFATPFGYQLSTIVLMSMLVL
jgi:di/tricarboxylate transporter